MTSDTQEFTKDWFSYHAKNWERILSEHKGKAGLRYLEIGSFEGRSAVWLLSNILTDPSCVIECADLFAPTEHGDYFPTFLKNIAPWRDRVVIHAGPSFETLPRISSQFDAIYVDGLHTAYGVLADAVMSWPRLKVGGIMIFDDYLWIPPEFEGELKRSWTYRKFAQLRGHNARHQAAKRVIRAHPAACPRTAIDSFLACLDGCHEVISKGTQLALRKTRNFV